MKIKVVLDKINVSHVMVSLDLKDTPNESRELFEVEMRGNEWCQENVSTTWTKTFNMGGELAMKTTKDELERARRRAKIGANNLAYVANVSGEDPVRFNTSP